MAGQPTSWTRFHLPLGQDWPIWPGNPADVQLGPLAGVEGCLKAWLGRIVETPEQAAFIILWETSDALEDFKESPACSEFLLGLPENDNRQASVVSGSSLRDLSLDNNSLPPPPSRFLTFRQVEGYPTPDLAGRVTFTALMIPHNDVTIRLKWYWAVRHAFGAFTPHGCEVITWRVPFPHMRHLVAWFWVIGEDVWVDEKFGKLEQNEGENNGRTILCEFRHWNGIYDATPELEEVSAKDPLARESWVQAVAGAMPPVTAWEQERWDIRVVPCFEIPEEDEDEDS